MADPLNQVLASFIADLRAIIEKYEDAPILVDLDIEPAIARVGQAATLNLIHALDGAAIAGIPPDGMTLDSAARTISGTPTQDGVYEIPLTQTLAGARNSPHPSTVTITVEPAIPVARGVTLGNSTIRLGNTKVRMNGVGGGGTTPTPQPVQNFSFGPPIGQPGEGTVAVQNFSFGPAIGSPGEGSVAVQNFSFGPALGTAGEETTVQQNFFFGSATTAASE